MDYAQHTDEGPYPGPQTERTSHGRRGAGSRGRCGGERSRSCARGEGGRGGGQGGRGEGQGHGGRHHGPHGHGFGPGFGPHFGRGHGARARRGDVRAAILLALAEEPMHGYQIMQQLEQRSGGAWRPSPGSVYPTLQLLEDQGLITGEESEGKRVFSLSEAGAEEAGKLKEKLGDSPWGEGGEQDPRFALRQAAFQLTGAVKQVAVTGSSDDAQKALEILREARKKLYALLAEAE